MDPCLAPDETLDRLSGDWWIFQLKRGHRYATDDVLTAFVALRARPGALRLLDLGSGVGSIGLLALRLLPAEARLTAVEVLARSCELAQRSARWNRVEDRVDLRLGDLRDEAVLAPGERFDLVTANPPFLTPGSGWVSPEPQRGAARFELHGDVFDYCRVAARHLAPGGRFCLCHAEADPRPEEAAAAAGLHVIERQPVVFREARPPHLDLFVLGLEAEGRRDLEPILVRDREGRRTAGYLEVMRRLGMVE